MLIFLKRINVIFTVMMMTNDDDNDENEDGKYSY